MQNLIFLHFLYMILLHFFVFYLSYIIFKLSNNNKIKIIKNAHFSKNELFLKIFKLELKYIIIMDRNQNSFLFKLFLNLKKKFNIILLNIFKNILIIQVLQ